MMRVTSAGGMMKPLELSEFTTDRDEFMRRRSGKITASRIADMMAGREGKTREKYKRQLAIERLTGNPIRGGFESRATKFGNDTESEALEMYSFQVRC